MWQDIEGYEGRYQVSDTGQVKSLLRGDRILKPFKTNAGYLYVNLYKNGVVNKFRVHRLVARTFIPNPKNLPEVNHIDEVKTNNKVTNLEWCTRKYNMNFGTVRQRSAIHRRRGILKVSKNKLMVFYPSIISAGRAGFNIGLVSDCANHKRGRKTAYGCHWFYSNDIMGIDNYLRSESNVR